VIFLHEKTESVKIPCFSRGKRVGGGELLVFLFFLAYKLQLSENVIIKICRII
jgi:hypothetical protein